MKIVPRNYFLDDVFDDFMGSEKIHHNPMKCDVYEKDGKYNIEVDIPGYSKDEVKVEAKDGYLTVSAEKNVEKKDENNDKKYFYHERRYGRVERSFYIGDMDSDNISAKLDNGILKITIPKVEETNSKKLIEIE